MFFWTPYIVRVSGVKRFSRPPTHLGHKNAHIDYHPRCTWLSEEYVFSDAIRSRRLSVRSSHSLITIINSTCLGGLINCCLRLYLSSMKSSGSQVAAVYLILVNSLSSFNGQAANSDLGTGTSNTRFPLNKETVICTCESVYIPTKSRDI
jgi:hypothetical protein